MLDKVAVNPDISLESTDVPAVREVVAKTVRRELEAREQQHSTNIEPAYQSRVAKGSLALFVGRRDAHRPTVDGQHANHADVYTAPAMILVGAALALYGRFIAKKPMGA